MAKPAPLKIELKIEIDLAMTDHLKGLVRGVVLEVLAEQAAAERRRPAYGEGFEPTGVSIVDPPE